MTPEQFAERMREIAEETYTEDRHINADNLMCDLLRGLGYGEGVDTFERMYKWYA